MALHLCFPHYGTCQTAAPTSKEKVVRMLSHMKQCADISTKPTNMLRCSCEGDLLLSTLPPPQDSSTHCQHVAAHNLQQIQLPEKEQLATSMETGAQDIRVTSLFIFSTSTPCLSKAIKADNRQDLEKCYCLAHEITNQLSQVPFSNSAELLMEAGTIINTLHQSQQCAQ